MCYKKAFDELLKFVEGSRDDTVDRSSQFTSVADSLIKFNNEAYFSYKTLIEKYEVRAQRTIENIAVALMNEYRVPGFLLYDDETDSNIYHARVRFSLSTKIKLVLEEDSVRTGVAFCITKQDYDEYCDAFSNGRFNIDRLQIVQIQKYNDVGYKLFVEQRNNSNKEDGLNIYIQTVEEFWEKYFGNEECRALMHQIEEFNVKVRDLVGFDTVVIPTEHALEKFRKDVSLGLKTFSYMDFIPTEISAGNIEKAIERYMRFERWNIMLGSQRFALSFISSEWHYKMYLLTENLDLTGIVAGYIKSIEQLLFEVFAIRNIKVKDIKKEAISFSEEGENTIGITLGSLQSALANKKWMIEKELDEDAYKCIVSIVEGWNDKYRKKYLHRGNLMSISTVNEIRNQAILLYALLLGSIHLKKEQIDELSK